MNNMLYHIAAPLTMPLSVVLKPICENIIIMLDNISKVSLHKYNYCKCHEKD